MPAIKSRSQHYIFKAADKNEITEFAAKILIKENVEFDLDTLDKYISVGYPDIRKIVNLIQQNCISGQLLNQATEVEAWDYKFALLDLISEDKWTEARVLACANVPGAEWEDVYRFLYENLDKSSSGKSFKLKVTIASALHLIAAATTWRSSGSGNSIVSINSSYP